MPHKCFLCDIIEGREGVRFVRIMEDIVAYRSPLPMAPVHIILAPKRHIPALTGITTEDADMLSRMLLLVPELARENAVFQCGFRLVANCGPDAGEEEGHLHFHLLGGTRLTDQLA